MPFGLLKKVAKKVAGKKFGMAKKLVGGAAKHHPLGRAFGGGGKGGGGGGPQFARFDGGGDNRNEGWSEVAGNARFDEGFGGMSPADKGGQTYGRMSPGFGGPGFGGGAPQNFMPGGGPGLMPPGKMPGGHMGMAVTPRGGGMGAGSPALNPNAWVQYGSGALGGAQGRMRDAELLGPLQAGNPMELRARQMAANSMRATGGLPQGGGMGMNGVPTNRMPNGFDFRRQ